MDIISAIAHGNLLPELVPEASPNSSLCRPGAIIGVSSGGERRLAGFGFADMESEVPITERTVFDCGSLAKQFTCAIALLLQERGDLDLDRPVAGYLPELADALCGVRVRDLILHTSGLRDYKALLAVAGARRYDYYSRADVLGILARQRSLAFAPGSAHQYSNSNYVVLARVVEQVAARPLGELCRSMLFEPSGMASTELADELSRLVPHRARSYARTEAGGFRVEFTPSEIVGDSGLLSTATDLLRWGEWLLASSDGSTAGSGLLSGGVLADGTPIRYGYGLLSQKIGEYACFRHGGSVDGFQSEWLVVPSRTLVVVALANWAQARPAVAVAGLLPQVLTEPVTVSRPRPADNAFAWPTVLTSDGDEVWQLCPGQDGGYALVGPSIQVYLTDAGNATLRGEHDGRPIVLSVTPPAGVPILRVEGRDIKLHPAPVDPRLDRRPLARYVGMFRSKELATTAIVWEEDGALYWRRRTATERLTWVSGDWFRAGATWLRFRFDDNRVVALRVDAPRAPELLFVAARGGD